MIRKTIQNYFLRRFLFNSFEGLQIEGDLFINGNKEHLFLGKDCRIADQVYFHLGGQTWNQFKGKLEIGDRCNFGPQVVIFAAGEGGVKIGDDFDCGPGTKIFSSRFEFDHVSKRHFEPVKIGNRVVCGANVVINIGVEIGDDVVIGANSLVLENIPSNSFYAGSPARFIRKIPQRHV